MEERVVEARLNETPASGTQSTYSEALRSTRQRSSRPRSVSDLTPPLSRPNQRRNPVPYALNKGFDGSSDFS